MAEWAGRDHDYYSSVNLSSVLSNSCLKLLKQKKSSDTTSRDELSWGWKNKKSMVAITARWGVTAVWKTNLCNLLKTFTRNWQTQIHMWRINGSKMSLRTHTAMSNSRAICALFIFDLLPLRSAIKLRQKCNWHWCLVMGHLEKFRNHSSVQTSKSRLHSTIMRPIISLMDLKAKAWD